jgi:hypothetical protein
MSAPLDVACPNCRKQLKVPPEFAGKTIRCKNCQAAFKVPGGPAPARPVAAKPAGPARAKPAAARPADPHAPIPFRDDEPAPKKPDDDDEEDLAPGQAANPYGVVLGDENIPRCPFCAKELDPPDTKVCLNCGYNLLERKRHDARVVYDTTTGDYFLHWLPAFACILAIIAMVTISVIFGLNMRDWLTGTLLDSEEKNDITGKTKFYIDPLCFNLFTWVVSAWLSFLAGRFAFRRLVLNWRPPEQRKNVELKKGI